MGALDKACRKFINTNSICKDGTSKSPELLAKFTDLLLKKSPKNPEEQEMDSLLYNVVRKKKQTIFFSSFFFFLQLYLLFEKDGRI